MNEDVIIVGEGVFEITVMEDPILAVLLTISGCGKHNSAWHADLG